MNYFIYQNKQKKGAKCVKVIILNYY